MNDEARLFQPSLFCTCCLCHLVVCLLPLPVRSQDKGGRRRGIQPSRSARTAEHSVNARAGDRLRLCMRRRLGFNRGGNGNAVLLGLLQLFAGDLKPHGCLTEIFNSYRIGEAVMSMMEPCGRSLSKLWSASRAAWSMLSFIAAACSWCSSSSLVGLRIRVSTPGPPL